MRVVTSHILGLQKDNIMKSMKSYMLDLISVAVFVTDKANLFKIDKMKPNDASIKNKP